MSHSFRVFLLLQSRKILQLRKLALARSLSLSHGQNEEGNDTLFKITKTSGPPINILHRIFKTNTTPPVKNTNQTPPEASSDSTRCGQNDSQRLRQQERVRKENDEREREYLGYDLNENTSVIHDRHI